MSKGLNWTDAKVAAHLSRFPKYDKGNNRSAVQTPELERNVEHAVQAKDTRQKVDQRFCIRFHSTRRRLIDPDGLYSKAAIDGLTVGGILADDNARIVREISYTQEIAEAGGQEQTVITVELIDSIELILK